MECPRCKEDMPLLSSICKTCGYVAQDDSDASSPKEIALKLEGVLRDIKIIPHPSFAKSMEQYTLFTYPVLTLFLLVISVITEALLFWVLCALFLLLSIYAIVRKTRGKLGNDPFDVGFKNLTHEFDYNKSIALMKYGKDREITNLIDSISQEIEQVNVYRKKMKQKNLVLWVIVFVVIFAFASFVTNSTSNIVSENKFDDITFEEVIKTHDLDVIEWETIVKKFNETSNPSSALKSEFMEIALNKEKFEYAVGYFESNILSNAGDYKIATMMIDYLRANSKDDIVESIKSKSAGKLRYNSDNDKLKKY